VLQIHAGRRQVQPNDKNAKKKKKRKKKKKKKRLTVPENRDQGIFFGLNLKRSTISNDNDANERERGTPVYKKRNCY